MTLQFGLEMPGQLRGFQHGMIAAEALRCPLHGQELERGVRVERHRQHSVEGRDSIMGSSVGSNFATGFFLDEITLYAE